MSVRQTSQSVTTAAAESDASNQRPYYMTILPKHQYTIINTITVLYYSTELAPDLEEEKEFYLASIILVFLFMGWLLNSSIKTID